MGRLFLLQPQYKLVKLPSVSTARAFFLRKENTLKNHRSILICLALAAVTIAVYLQAMTFGFVSFDDDWYVYNNSYIKDGFTRQSIAWAFSFADQVAQTGNWHPLTSLSHILDVQLFGLNAQGHHFANVLLHTVNTLLLFLALQYMTAKTWRSAFVAALFALHPLHVESVAWVSERKDVLSTLFWLLTMFSYAWYARHPSVGKYVLTLAAFAAGLLAKPMLVTLPFVLLLLDYWPLGRFQLVPVDTFEKRRNVGRLIIEKIPFFILSASACVVTMLAQQSTWAVATSEELPLKARLLNVPISYVRYIEKMLRPANLAFLYPHRGSDTSVWLAGLSAAFLIILSIAVIYFWRKRKYVPVGWLWYLGTLVPVIGIIQVGRQAMADRYTYTPLIGLFIIVSWGASDLLAGSRYSRKILSAAAAVVLLSLSILSWRQIAFWRDDIALYKRAVDVVPDNSWACQLLGNAYLKAGRFDEAVNSYNQSLRLAPGSVEVLNDLGYALLQQGKLDEAITLYQKMLPPMPDANEDSLSAIPAAGTPNVPMTGKLNATIEGYSQAHLNLGAALERQGKADEALKHYIEALRIKPEYNAARKNLANLLAMQGKFELAIEQFEKCLLAEPDSADLHEAIAYPLMVKGRYDDAIMHVRESIRLQPNSVSGYYKLGLIYKQQGNLLMARDSFSSALNMAQAAGSQDAAAQITAQLNSLESR